MKQIIIILFISLLYSKGFSQNTSTSKAFLFNNYPSSINFSEAHLNSLFTAQQGQLVDIDLESNFKIKGPVTSNLIKYQRLQTVVIKLQAFNNILFSLSKRQDEDNNTVFVGHILNNSYADGYELKRNSSKQYQLIKIETEKLLQPCH